jgi:hypothetical protein
LVREAVKENFIKKDFAENTLKLGIVYLFLKKTYSNLLLIEILNE